MENKFAERFKELRLANGLSQASTGKFFYVSQNTISSWENGKQEPNISSLILIAQKFGVTIDFLVGLSNY